MENNSRNKKYDYFAYFGIGVFLLVGVLVVMNFTRGSDLTTSMIGDVEKTYDISNQLVVLKDTKTGIEVSAKLDTPQINYVPVGYQKVAQFTINSSQDYSSILGSFEFYDLNDGSKEIIKTIDLKYLTYEETITKNGTNLGKREVWNDFNGNVVSKEKMIIGVFTNVNLGDKVEWVPTIAGVKVEEWATYQTIFEAHGIAMESTDSGCSGYTGVRFHTNQSILVWNITKHASDGSTNGSILNADKTVKATASFSGVTANFSSPVNLSANTDYWMAGNDVTPQFSGAGTFYPVNGIAGQFLGSTWCSGSNYTNSAFTITGFRWVNETADPAIACNFTGYVKDGATNALSGAEVIIFNHNNKSEVYNTSTAATGWWTINITNSTKNFTAVSYYNKTQIGQAKPFISGTC